MDGNGTSNFTGYQYTVSQTPQAPKKKQHRGGAWVVALALCFVILGGAIGGGTVWLLTHNNTTSAGGSSSTTIQQGRHENVTVDINEIETGKLMTAAEVYAKNVNSTVGIQTSITSTNLWGQQTTSAASGSGFILTADGYIVTNYHVIQNANSVTVSTYGGASYNAKIVGYDESNDLAVLKIEATGLSPVVLGSSEKLNVGDTVLAIGNPLGELTFSLTTGVVSALNREVTFSGGTVMDLLQTDCAINSGNSGGALFNLYGEVVGITNAKYSGSSSSGASIDNIAFAIPIDSVRAIVESIIEKGYYAKPVIGVSVTDVDENSRQLGIPAGAWVKEVTAGGAAEAAGIQANDVITAINGTEISGVSDLKRILAKASAGDELSLAVWRKNQSLTLTVVVREAKVSNAG
jgi:serine protease Do